MVAWQIFSTPPLSGEENMDIDRQALDRVSKGDQPATLRFFRWARPSLSYGRLQKLEKIQALIPEGWPAVQRPTGGGIVFHQSDLCFSLCWRRGQPPLPIQPTAQYRWIHTVVKNALTILSPLQMKDATPEPADEPFDVRQCFSLPSPFDLVIDDRKIVGGALAARREASLYQGVLQTVSPQAAEPLLTAAFQKEFGRA